MTDTQWPRFQVFHQAKEAQAHQNTGSVHAPDSEMALLIARDVFVRRPDCTSLWVVPADQIFSKTAQELEDPSWLEEAIGPETQLEPYYVFGKLKHKDTHTYLGTVEAHTPAGALRQALNTFADQVPLVWWVVSAYLVTQSTSDDIESLFEPARDKRFRDQAEYHTVALMQDIRKARDEGS